VTTSPEPAVADAPLEGGESQRVAELEREVALWKLRAENAEDAIAVWRATQGRSLWRFLLAVDRLRTRVAPPRTRRDRVVRAAAHRFSNTLLRLGRDVPQRIERIAPMGQKAVLFVFDELGGICTRYRCDHQAEQLKFLGVSHDVAHSAEIDLPTAVDHYECFLLSRVAWTDEVATFFERARSRHKVVIFDTDDLIFEPDLDQHFAFLDSATSEQRAAWIEKLRAYLKTLEACDGVIVTTEALQRFARRRNERVEVVFNAVSEELLRLADDALGAAVHDVASYAGRDVTIGYLSGTPTHNRDFREAADAVLWALETYANTRLLIVGKLDLDPRFARFSSRVASIRKQPWQAVPGILAGVDINLAPLERENPFTESKSCLKYLEAGLLGVPTIASRRSDYARAIDHGRNGMLADNPYEWREALRLLIESKDLRRDIGLVAYEDVRRNQTTKARARLLEQAFGNLARNARNDERRLSVNWLFGAAGSRHSRELAGYLAESGHLVRVYTEAEAYDDLRPADVSIATDRRGAQAVVAHDASLFKWLLISNVGDDHGLYDLPLRHICLGKEVAEQLTALTGRPVNHVGRPEELEYVLLGASFVAMGEISARQAVEPAGQTPQGPRLRGSSGRVG
jgi:glycosyltransferase involved in cell wall biosynthesis